ncbi:MAG: hypothetical protein JNG88_04295 [Phycisphaerales bacterium]|nr:hypothetical protein [Phycisphaerales bacterium]
MAAVDARTRRVLILHQQSGVCRALGPWLQQRGHLVHLVVSVSHVRGTLAQWPADLVVVDLDDSGDRAVSLINHLREAAHAVKRFIVISGRSEAEQILATIDEPRMHVYLRPFSPQRLLRDIETLHAPPAGVVGPSPTAASISRFVVEGAMPVAMPAEQRRSVGDIV